MSKKGWGKFVAGAMIGAGLGILFAPQKGSETRKELKEKIDILIDKVKKVDPEEVRTSIQNKIEEIKMELADLDKEKVLKIAKAKGRAIAKKADEVVQLAVKKGTPVLKKAAEDVREKTIEVLEDMIFKLEKKEVKTKTKTKKTK